MEFFLKKAKMGNPNQCLLCTLFVCLILYAVSPLYSQTLGFRSNPAHLYAFPFKAEDLKGGERVFTGDHAGFQDPNAIQRYGEDLGVVRYLGDQEWIGIKAGTEGTKITDYLIYNKPFYAMEDGVVCGCWRNAPEPSDEGQRDRGDLMGMMAGGGNHLWILQDNGVYALYAHATPGSIPASLCPKSAALFPWAMPDVNINPQIHPFAAIPERQRPRVRKGQYLGRVGASATDRPHLHVHMEKDGNPIPMRFEKGLTSAIRITNNDYRRLTGRANINNWDRLNGNAVINGDRLIWPPRTVGGEYTRFAFAAQKFKRMFDHLSNSGFAPNWIDGYSVGNKAFLNFSWGPSNGKPWKAYYGLKGAGYQQVFKARGGFKPTFVDTYTVDGEIRYNVIFKQESGPFKARHGLSYEQHKNVMGEALREGLEPVNISVASVNGKRLYTVLYSNRNVGGWKIKSQIKESDYQRQFDQQKAAGFMPVYLNAYKHGRDVFLSAVFVRNPQGQIMAGHGLSGSALQQRFETATRNRYQSQIITAFDGADRQHRFAGIWKR